MNILHIRIVFSLLIVCCIFSIIWYKHEMNICGEKRPIGSLNPKACEPSRSVELNVHSAEAWSAEADLRNISNLPNMAKMEGLHLERQRRVEEVCNKLNASGGTLWNGTVRYGTGITGHGNCYYLDDPKIMMCRMPKTGSKDLLRLLCSAMGKRCAPGIFKQLKRATEEQIKNKTFFGEFFSFSTVRNPWTRLVSAYTHKFLETDDYLAIINKKVWGEFDRLHRRSWPFKDFIEKVVLYSLKNHGPAFIDEHWRPQHLIGVFCTVEYSFIHKFEHANTERKILLKHFGAGPGEIDSILSRSYSQRMEFEKRNKTESTYSKLWATIDLETIDQLRTLYALDIEMFDYPNSP